MHFRPSNIALAICIIGTNMLIIEDKAHLFKSVDVQRDLREVLVKISYFFSETSIKISIVNTVIEGYSL